MSDPLVIVCTDGEQPHRPDALVVVVPPARAPCWEWDEDWPTDPAWLRAVARLAAHHPEPVGACVCGPHLAALLPGNESVLDAAGRALAVAGDTHRGARRAWRVVLRKQDGRPLLARPERALDAAAAERAVEQATQAVAAAWGPAP